MRHLSGVPYDVARFGHIDFYNATDYAFQTLLGGGQRVLDFGAGYGRQAFLWTTQNPTLVFVAVDGIEGPYLLQNRVLQQLEGVHFLEYMELPETFRIAPPSAGAVKIYHLPTWRLDLLPGSFFDRILCVQVLQELPDALLHPLLEEFRRIIAPGGKLYIRDHEYWRPAHKFKVGKHLLENGWRLAFRYPGIDKRDIHGIPRLWTFTGEDTSELTDTVCLLKRKLWLARPWTTHWDEASSTTWRGMLKSVYRYLRSGNPRMDDLLDPLLPL